MHGLVEKQGLEREPESRVKGATSVCRSLVGEMGLACVRVEVECERVSGTPQRSISGPQGPGTTTTLVRTEQVLHLTVKTSSFSPLKPENPEACRQEPSWTETAGSSSLEPRPQVPPRVCPTARNADSLCRMHRLPSCLYSAFLIG